jgi:hypothetical protein
MEELIDGPHRSKLTFVASPESTEPIELGRLRRVREPVSRSKSGVQGKVADVASGRSRHAESQNELTHFESYSPRHILMSGRSSLSVSNITTTGQSIGTHPTFLLFGALIAKSSRSRKTRRPKNPRIRHVLP